MIIAQTVFQSMEMSLDAIAFLLLISMIVLCVIAARLGKILKQLRETEKRRTDAERIRGLEPIRDEPLPQPLRLTEQDVQEAAAYTERLSQAKRPPNT
jgi:hypothetical protein